MSKQNCYVYRTAQQTASLTAFFGRPEQVSIESKLTGRAWGAWTEYCESLPDTAASDRCWQAYNFFESKKREAEGSCDVEASSGVAGGSGALARPASPHTLTVIVQAGRRLCSQVCIVQAAAHGCQTVPRVVTFGLGVLCAARPAAALNLLSRPSRQDCRAEFAKGRAGVARQQHFARAATGR